MGKVYINAEGKFLHFSEVATHTSTGYVYSWVDLNQATVVKDGFALRGVRWKNGDQPEVVAQLAATEVRTVTLDEAGPHLPHCATNTIHRKAPPEPVAPENEVSVEGHLKPVPSVSFDRTRMGNFTRLRELLAYLSGFNGEMRVSGVFSASLFVAPDATDSVIVFADGES